MVGVAGKSKGCGTCRRRKVKCDLRKPFCQNCTRVGRECEGYRKFPIFLNSTANGQLRREPLEEVDPQILFPQAHAIPEAACLQHDQPTRSRETMTSGTSLLAYNLNNTPIFIQHMTSWFWSSYATTSPGSICRKNEPRWIYLSLQLPTPDQSLASSLAALATVRYGRAFGNQDLVIKGKQLYGVALRHLKSSLYDSRLSRTDDVLGAVNFCILFEFFESSKPGENGWFDHVSGVGKIFEHVGSKIQWSPLRVALFENSRYLLMLEGFLTSKVSVFGKRDWILDPWMAIEKSYQQRVYDQGFALSHLLETTRRLRRNPTPEFACHALRQGKQLIQTISALDNEVVLSGDDMHRLEAERAEYDDAPTTQLQILHTMCQKMRSWAHSELMATNLNDMVAETTLWSNTDLNDAVSRQILRAMKIIQQHDDSLFASSRLLFPIMVVTANWIGRQGVELAQCHDLRAQLIERRGMGFGQTLGNYRFLAEWHTKWRD